jgi:hypothetical protein
LPQLSRAPGSWRCDEAQQARRAEERTCGDLDRQRDACAKNSPSTGEFKQFTWSSARRRSASSNRHGAWRTRLEQFDRDLEREPERIREFYEVRAKRVEPVGLVYLWPETN